ncbi:hypothetical protein LTS18_013179 [Coniosporium uncinatum]|uniref:Uncharacterized protein n=1 Tax=Coniosporium uncinatum TaxID=93489 RepID=A0ACC3DIL1_9PEZI|nr:hypothetical protein LTS18_013179 [Coniosporium uncinatum]
MTATSPEQHVKDLLQTYRDALNSSDLDLALSLYSADGVFMAPHSSPAVGKAAVKQAYEGLFGEVDHIVELSVEEVVVVGGGEWAFARSMTRGQTRVRASGELHKDAVWQLWVLKREGEGDGKGEGAWRIARYSFSPVE